MAKNVPKQRIPQDKLPYNVDLFIRMSARGCTRPEILKEVFKIEDPSDPDAYPAVHSADCKMTRWRKHPLFHQTWDDEMKKLDYSALSKAKLRLRQQLDNSNDWLVNKAANDLITQGTKRIYGDEDSAIKVKIEGMPEIGSPDGEE